MAKWFAGVGLVSKGPWFSSCSIQVIFQRTCHSEICLAPSWFKKGRKKNNLSHSSLASFNKTYDQEISKSLPYLIVRICVVDPVVKEIGRLEPVEVNRTSLLVTIAMVVVGHLRFAGIGKRPGGVELQQPNNVDNNNNTDVADKTDVSFILFRSVFFLTNFITECQ